MVEHFTEEQINEFKEAFSAYDGGDGKVAAKDCGTAMRSLGHNPTQAQLAEWTATATRDGSGTVDFPNFLLMMSKKLEDPEEDEEDIIKEYFRTFDKEGAGFLNAVELRNIMTSIGDKLTDDEVDEMIREADIDGNGIINYDAFVTMMSMKA